MQSINQLITFTPENLSDIILKSFRISNRVLHGKGSAYKYVYSLNGKYIYCGIQISNQAFDYMLENKLLINKGNCTHQGEKGTRYRINVK